MEYIYHYTSGKHLKEILKDGKLIVSEWEKKNKIKPPALWLSKNPVWEPTATKLINENGRIRELSMEEQHQLIGCFRFIIPFKKESLCSWKAYKYKRNTPNEEYNAMERVGIKEGANPYDWFASFRNIQLTNCIACEKWNGNEWELLIDFTLE